MEAQPRNVEVFVAGVGVILAVENVDCSAPLLISFASWKEEADGDNRGILYAAVMGLVQLRCRQDGMRFVRETTRELYPLRADGVIIGVATRGCRDVQGGVVNGAGRGVFACAKHKEEREALCITVHAL